MSRSAGGHINVPLTHGCARMYLFAGAWTIVWSFVVLYMIPDSPRTATRWFSARERALLVRRTRSNQTGLTELASFDWKQAKEAACDVKIWLFLIMAAGIYVCNGAVTAFATQIIKSFGYTSLQTLALSIPGQLSSHLTGSRSARRGTGSSEQKQY